MTAELTEDEIRRKFWHDSYVRYAVLGTVALFGFSMFAWYSIDTYVLIIMSEADIPIPVSTVLFLIGVCLMMWAWIVILYKNLIWMARASKKIEEYTPADYIRIPREEMKRLLLEHVEKAGPFWPDEFAHDHNFDPIEVIDACDELVEEGNLSHMDPDSVPRCNEEEDIE